MKRILCSMFIIFLLMGLSGNAMAQNPFFLTITGDDESYSMFINNGKVIHGSAETPEQMEIVSGAYDGADLQFTIVNDDLSDCDQWLTHNFEICESEVILRTTVDKCGNVLTDINKIYSASIVNIVTEQDSPTTILGPQKGYEVDDLSNVNVTIIQGWEKAPISEELTKWLKHNGSAMVVFVTKGGRVRVSNLKGEEVNPCGELVRHTVPTYRASFGIPCPVLASICISYKNELAQTTDPEKQQELRNKIQGVNQMMQLGGCGECREGS